jgi:hypothetical protein
MSAEWKFPGTPPLTSGPAAAEALRKLVARLDVPGRSRFGLLEAPPEIASLRAEIPADPGQRAVDSFGSRLAGILNRVAPQSGGTGGAPSSGFPKMNKGFPSPPKRWGQGKSLRAEGVEEAEGTAKSSEGMIAAQKQTVPIEPDPVQLQAIFQRHRIDPADQHGRHEHKMEAQGQDIKKFVAPTSVLPIGAPSVAVPPKNNRQGTKPQPTEPQSPHPPGSVLITTHGNEYLGERKSPLEIHAASLAEGRSAARGAAMPIETSPGLPRNDLLRLAAPRQHQTANKQQKYPPKKPEPTNAPPVQPPKAPNSSSEPRPFREIGGIPSPSPERRHDSFSRATAPDFKRGWTSESPSPRSDAATDFQTAIPQRKAAERPAFPGQLGQLLARWEDQPPEAGENIPSQRSESMPSAANDSHVSTHSDPKTWNADPDEFARRVEDTLESVLIREVRRHGLDPEEP